MKFEVFHKNHPTFQTGTRAGELALDSFPEGFTKVADVDAPELGATFELTNHINRPWQENPGVTATNSALGGARSTSVGDVVVDENGNRFEVAGIGFQRF